jgi:hypothetical protein
VSSGLACSGSGNLRLAATLLLARAPLFFFAFGQLLLGLGALLRGLFFGFLFQSRLGLADLLQPALPPLQLGRQFVAVPILAVLRILFGIGLFGGGQQRIDLLLQARLGLVHVLVAHRLVLAGVGLDLGSIDGHMAQLHQSSLGTQQQSLREQTRERLQMTLAELGDGGVVGVLVAGKITEGHVLECARLNLARTVDAPRIAVQQQTDHHLRRVGRLPAAILLLIRLVDRAQIQRRDHIQKKAGQVALGKPIVKRWGKQKRLVDRVRNEVLAHGSNLKQNLLPTL